METKDATTVLQLFENHPERWCKGSLAKDKYGNNVPFNCDNAASWCLAGSLYKIYGNDYHQHTLNLIISQMFRKNGIAIGTASTTGFNDNSATTFKDILTVVKEAGI